MTTAMYEDKYLADINESNDENTFYEVTQSITFGGQTLENKEIYNK